MTDQDKPERFKADNAPPSSTAFDGQPDKGRVTGFDFYRDPLNAKTPNQNPDDIVKEDTAAKPKVMADQRKLLESRYNLEPKLDPQAKMSRGKPLVVGPTARLQNGLDWDKMAQLAPQAIHDQGVA